MRAELFLFCRTLARVVDYKYDYKPPDLTCIFSNEVFDLLTHCLTKMGYIASHFLGRYVFWHGIPNHFLSEFVPLRVNVGHDETAVWNVPFASLPRFIFESLCVKMQVSVHQPLWQCKQHLFGEWLAFSYFFRASWNDYGNRTNQPFTIFPAFLKRWQRETTDQTLETQLANKLNTNPNLYGNASTNEAMHSYANNNHKIGTVREMSFREDCIGVIGLKLNKIKRFKTKFKSDPHWSTWCEVTMIEQREDMMSVITQCSESHLTRLKDFKKPPSLDSLKEQGFVTKPKHFADQNDRMRRLNHNGNRQRVQNISNMVEMMSNDEDLFGDGDVGGNRNANGNSNGFMNRLRNEVISNHLTTKQKLKNASNQLNQVDLQNILDSDSDGELTLRTRSKKKKNRMKHH